MILVNSWYYLVIIFDLFFQNFSFFTYNVGGILLAYSVFGLMLVYTFQSRWMLKQKIIGFTFEPKNKHARSDYNSWCFFSRVYRNSSAEVLLISRWMCMQQLISCQQNRLPNQNHRRALGEDMLSDGEGVLLPAYERLLEHKLR